MRSYLCRSHFRSLLSLPKPERKKFIQKALKKHLNSRQLQKAIAAQRAGQKVLHIPTDGQIPRLKFERGKLFTCKVITPPSLQAGEGYKFIDQGFDAWQKVPVADLSKFEDGTIVESVKVKDRYKIKSSERAAKDLYTFKAVVERVVDGDTLLVHVDCGFDHWRREYLRFRGIDCPELSTPDGQKVKRFIESRLKPNDFVIIKTHKDDKYGRYLVDVFYLMGETNGDKVAAEGKYLNQELLDNRLALEMKS